MNRLCPSSERLSQEIDSYFQNKGRQYAYSLLVRYLEAKFVISLQSMENEIQDGILRSKNFIEDHLSSIPQINVPYLIVASSGALISRCWILPIFQSYLILEFESKRTITGLKVTIHPPQLEIYLKSCDLGDSHWVRARMDSDLHNFPPSLAKRLMVRFQAPAEFEGDFLLVGNIEVKETVLFPPSTSSSSIVS
jgi:hypothetical protein